MSNLAKILKLNARKLREDFEEATQNIPHLPSRGLARENVLKKHLKYFLPSRFSVDTGFVIDTSGGISKQIDVIIYDKLISNFFEVPEGIRYFPCETVVAVGEVKTNCSSRDELLTALEKIKSVKCLDRTSGGENLEIASPSLQGHMRDFDPKNDIRDNVFGFIFTSNSMKKDSTLKILQEFNRQNPKHLWMNLFVDYNSHMISYHGKISSRDKTPSELVPSPIFAEKMYCSKEEEVPNLILNFFAVLINFLTFARVTRPFLLKYLQSEKSYVDLFDVT